MDPVLVEHKIVIDDIPLNYTEAGNGSHVIMFCCGLCGFAEVDFGPIFRQMDPTKFRMICCDPPGYGKSRPHNRDFRWSEYLQKDAKIYLKLLDLLGITKVSVAGWSSGGTTAQMMTLYDDRPDRIRKLVFWGSYATLDTTFVRFPRAFRSNKMFAPEYRQVMLKQYGETYWQELLDKWADAVEAMYKIQQGKAFITLDGIKCPTLIFQGQMDGMVKDEQAQMCHAAIKNSKLIMFPTARHDLHLSHIDQFLPALESFLLKEENS